MGNTIVSEHQFKTETPVCKVRCKTRQVGNIPVCDKYYCEYDIDSTKDPTSNVFTKSLQEKMLLAKDTGVGVDYANLKRACCGLREDEKKKKKV